MSDIASRAKELALEVAAFEQDRDMLKKVLGGIGGKVYSRLDMVLNVVFLAIVVGLFTLGITTHIIPIFVSLEVGVLLVSLKIAWMIHTQQKHQHFQFWVLNTIEFRINEVLKRLARLEGREREERRRRHGACRGPGPGW